MKRIMALGLIFISLSTYAETVKEIMEKGHYIKMTVKEDLIVPKDTYIFKLNKGCRLILPNPFSKQKLLSKTREITFTKFNGTWSGFDLFTTNDKSFRRLIYFGDWRDSNKMTISDLEKACNVIIQIDPAIHLDEEFNPNA